MYGYGYPCPVYPPCGCQGNGGYGFIWAIIIVVFIVFFLCRTGNEPGHCDRNHCC